MDNDMSPKSPNGSMEDAIWQQEQLLSNIKILNDFTTLSMARKDIKDSPLFKEIIELTKEVHALLEECSYIANNEMDSLVNECAKAMQLMRQKEALVLDYIYQKRVNDLKASALQNNNGNKITPCQTPANQKYEESKSLYTTQSILTNTKLLSIAAYKESPMIKRKQKPQKPIHLLEFEMQLSPKRFEELPQYMRGRTTFAELQSFHEKVIIECFNKKYQLLLKDSSSVAIGDMELWSKYKHQMALLPKRHFITEEDILHITGKKVMEKKTNNLLTMLRHLGILSIERTSVGICYIWCRAYNP